MSPCPATRAVAVLLLATALVAGCSRGGKLRQAEIHIQAARAFLAESKPDKAVAELHKALALAPDHLETHLVLGLAYAHQGLPDEANEKFRYVLDRDPTSATAHEYWGAALVLQGREADALPKYEAATKLDPSSSSALLGLGAALVKLRRYPEAVAAFERVAAPGLEPSAELLVYWGTALHHMGRRDEARQKYEAALARDPDYLSAKNNLALLLVRSEPDRTRGIALLEEVLDAKPADPATLQNLGWAYMEAGRYEEAYNLLQRSLSATDPSHPLYEKRLENLKRAEEHLPRSSAAPGTPNVVLVLIDTLRADHLSSYGYHRKTTPNIDAFASGGVLFEHAISQAPWTAASTASLFTGLYPSVHGIDGGISWGKGQTAADGTIPFAIQRVLSSAVPTLASVLRRSGYRTAGFVSNVYVNSIFGFSQGFDVYDDEHEDYSVDVWKIKRRAEETNQRTFAWLDKQRREPFLLFLQYNDPHWPYDPLPPYGEEYVAGYKGKLTPKQTSVLVQTFGKPISGLTPEDVDYIVGLYDGEIAYVDAQVGRLLEKIRALPLERDVVFVITADHGEEFLEHGSGSHGFTLYEEQIRVPLVFRYDGHLPPGRLHAQARLVDVLPTLLELTGVELPPGIQGQSLVPLMKGGSRQGAVLAFSEATYRGDQTSVRSEDGLKLIHRGRDDTAMLFDLKRDPGEQKDVLGEDPSRGEKLKGEILSWHSANEGARTALHGSSQPREVVLDSDTLDRLRALGYVE